MLEHDHFNFIDDQDLASEILKTYQDAQKHSGSAQVGGDDSWFDYFPNCQEFLIAVWRSVFVGESGVIIHEYEASQATEIIPDELVKKLVSYVVKYSDARFCSGFPTDPEGVAETTAELINDWGVPADRIIQES